MNDLTNRAFDLNIEILDHRVELLAAAAGCTSCTTSCCCRPPVPQPL